MEEFGNGELEKVNKSLKVIEAELDKAKKFAKLVNNAMFNELIIDDLLEGEAKKLADRLVYDLNSKETEESILTKLCGLRTVRDYLNNGVAMVPVLEARLAKEDEFRKQLLKYNDGER